MDAFISWEHSQRRNNYTVMTWRWIPEIKIKTNKEIFYGEQLLFGQIIIQTLTERSSHNMRKTVLVYRPSVYRLLQQQKTESEWPTEL